MPVRRGKEVEMEDYIVRGSAADGQIRAFATTTREMVEYARKAHNTSPVVTTALGRLMTGGAMMGTMMKGDSDIMTLQIQCQGPIGGMTVTVDSKANVKGYANNADVVIPVNEKGQLDVATGLGLGVLNVIKDIGLKEPYVGQTILVTSEVADDLTYYFATSEQVPSSVGLGVLMSKDNTVKQAGGFIIQLMPGAEEDVIDRLEKKVSTITSVTDMLEAGKTPEMILETILGEFGFKLLEKVPTKFSCNCSKDRMAKALISIGKKDIQEMIDDGKPMELNCRFCNSNYEFDKEEMKAVLEAAL